MDNVVRLFAESAPVEKPPVKQGFQDWLDEYLDHEVLMLAALVDDLSQATDAATGRAAMREIRKVVNSWPKT